LISRNVTRAHQTTLFSRNSHHKESSQCKICSNTETCGISLVSHANFLQICVKNVFGNYVLYLDTSHAETTNVLYLHKVSMVSHSDHLLRFFSAVCRISAVERQMKFNLT